MRLSRRLLALCAGAVLAVLRTRAVDCTFEEASANADIFYNSYFCDDGRGGQRVAPRCDSCGTYRKSTVFGERVARECAGRCCIDIISRNPTGTPAADLSEALLVHVYNTATVAKRGFTWTLATNRSRCDDAALVEGPSAACRMKTCQWSPPKGLTEEELPQYRFGGRARSPASCGTERRFARREAACMAASGSARTTVAAPVSSATAATDEAAMAGDGATTPRAAADATVGSGGSAVGAPGSGLSLGATVSITLGAIALFVLAGCVLGARLRARAGGGSKRNGMLGGDEFEPLGARIGASAGVDAAGPAPAAAYAYAAAAAAAVATTFEATAFAEDRASAGLPPSPLFVCYPAGGRGSGGGGRGRGGGGDPADPRAPLHLALAVDTSRSGACSGPTRATWSKSLGAVLAALAARVVELEVTLVSFAGDDAVEVAAGDSDTVVRAVTTVQPPDGEGMRRKARSASHVKAVDVCHGALRRSAHWTQGRRRILIVSASDVSDGETQTARGARPPAGHGWQPPAGVGVVAAGISDGARPEALVQLGRVAVKCHSMEVLGRADAAEALAHLLLAPVAGST